jgi:7,8-dihydro-6-hydroxymethylpterin-pyrophosphokinase
MARVYLSLGSNLGDRLALLRAAIASLRQTAGMDFV